MNVRTLCLAMLTCGEASGYEIKKQSVEGHWRVFVEASYGSIYPALKGLEAEGLVSVREETDPGKPARKVYAITEAGRAVFAQALGERPGPDDYRSEFLLLAKFAELAGPEPVGLALDAREAALRAEMEGIRLCLAQATHPGSRWIMRYGLAVYEASLAFLEENRAELEAIAEGQTRAVAAE